MGDTLQYRCHSLLSRRYFFSCSVIFPFFFCRAFFLLETNFKMAAKPLVTVADQNFFAASIEKELVARTAWAAKFKHLLDRPIRKSEFRPFDLPSIPCEPKDQTGKYAVKRINYDKQHLDMIECSGG